MFRPCPTKTKHKIYGCENVFLFTSYDLLLKSLTLCVTAASIQKKIPTLRNVTHNREINWLIAASRLAVCEGMKRWCDSILNHRRWPFSRNLRAGSPAECLTCVFLSLRWSDDSVSSLLNPHVLMCSRAWDLLRSQKVPTRTSIVGVGPRGHRPLKADGIRGRGAVLP